MTHHPIRIEADGTRVYANYHRYRPLPPEERTYAVRKPDDPRAQRWGGEWLLPLELLPDGSRAPLPETRPDTDAYDHMERTANCRCRVCLRPQADAQRQRWHRDRAKARRLADRR